MPCNCKPGKMHSCYPHYTPVLDLTKPVQTVDGRAVRLICTDGPGNTLWGFLPGYMYPVKWESGGSSAYGGGQTLINVPPKPRGLTGTAILYLTAAGRLQLAFEQPSMGEGAKARILGRCPMTITEGDGM